MISCFVTRYPATRLTSLVVAMITLGLVSFAVPVSAQTTGPVEFGLTESALGGTYACGIGPSTPIPDVDASITNLTGSNEQQASNLSASACGFQLYSIGTADDATSASDMQSEDDGVGSSNLQNVSLLRGLVTYTAKTESDACSAIDSEADIACTSEVTIQNLRFGGQSLTGTFTQTTTFPLVNVSVQLPGACTGAALFTGQLIVGAVAIEGVGTPTVTATGSPLELKGTLTCVGLPLGSITVDLKDYVKYVLDPPISIREVLYQQQMILI